ncbi:MAG: hypothetical protein ACR2NN_27080 [Bryobacteraceae bacterium]
MIAKALRPNGHELASLLRPFGRAQAQESTFADRLASFTAYQHDERGWSAVTIRAQGWHVENFLSWLGEQNRSFDDVCLEM